MKFNWKKYLAIAFAILGAAFTVAQFGIDMWSASQSAFTPDIFITIINFLIMVLVCYYLLSGNINSNYSAYSGMLMFIFLITFEFAELFFFNSVSIFSLLVSGELAYVLVGSTLLAVVGGAVVTGVFSYIKTRQYITKRYYNYKVVFILSLIFTILTVLFSLYTAFAYPLLSGTFSIQLIDFSAVGDACLALSVFFTVMRLSPND